MLAMTMDVIALDTNGNATELEPLMCVFLQSSSQVKTLTVKGIFEKKLYQCTRLLN